ncbi:hypothetical protein [Streptomyces ipomoeae]|uniref:Uncharacterized protein n=1 Tax=Streptomyces ipomoeae 91-03 TaxID=698759 RepID=L1KY39_9ACTN|nr:hypothetical protein [Streptomyces ipomoeae]EKX65464.1 hypothetical protein STRIP9103_01802 [Streptomyces ipomoeae 91-03]MDX2696321.1 hypothetical protein [Streptomyces ipomoeae]MDX2843833.1 hypothetical protein [Streptomyces ipomoeae]
MRKVISRRRSATRPAPWAVACPSYGTEQASLAFDSRTLRGASEPYQRALLAAARAAADVSGAGQLIPAPGAPGRDPHHA